MTIDVSQVKNIFTKINESASSEEFEILFQNSDVKIERIISHGQASPPGFWYEQEQDEWVLLLSGSAQLEFVNGTLIDLKEGDHILIPAFEKHRVNKTSKDPNSFWLAIHMKK